MKIINEILSAISFVLDEYFFGDDGIMSRELINILSHPHDRKIYRDAVERLHSTREAQTIQLSTGTITITCFHK